MLLILEKLLTLELDYLSFFGKLELYLVTTIIIFAFESLLFLVLQSIHLAL